jgi:uncharacterized protein (DUF1501 family)
MVLGDNIKGGRIIGSWPTLVDEKFAVYGAGGGPGGLPITHDYRSVFTEVLRGAMGLEQADAVFPKFTPQPVGLV